MFLILNEMTIIFENQIEHASLTHPPAEGVVQRSHSEHKRTLMFNNKKRWKKLFQYAQFASLFETRPIILQTAVILQFFFMYEPAKPLDVRLCKILIERFSPNSKLVFTLQGMVSKKFSKNT